MEIRPATENDLPDIAHLHAASWKATYRGMLPDAYLDGPMADDLTRQWAAPAPQGAIRLVADTGATLTGFAATLARGDTTYLDNLHVAPNQHGQGTGSRLLRAVAAEAQTRGFTRLDLTVLINNHKARAFYTQLGGTEGPPFDDDLFGQRVQSCHITWTNLAKLAR